MKHILTVFYVCVITLFTQAQDINGVSTNPKNPVNPPFLPWANKHLSSGFTYDPFLNSFDWRPVDLNGHLTDFIPIEYNTGFNIAGISLSNNQIPMRNPFNTGMSSGASSYIDEILKPYVRDRDFWWEDGWELLYMNLGYTPSLQLIDLPDTANPLDIIGPNPVHAPYFVLYNRYKGTIRLFSNVWFNTTTANKPQKVIATLKFNNDYVNGLLRHNSSFDLALDQPTEIKQISGPSYNFEHQFSWMMSDFQVGFDPCICNRTTNNTWLHFEFGTMHTMDIDMTSRSIAINKTITDNSYLSDDFLNLGNVDFYKPNEYKPGSRMYKEMGGMLDAYKAAQLQYEKDLANYKSIDGILKRAVIDILKDGITSTGSVVGAGVAGSFFTNGPMRNFILKNKTRVGLFSGELIALDTNDADAFAKSVTGATKSIIASGFDFLSTTFDVPDKPIKPSPPTATFAETTYKGQITTDTRFRSDNLLIPGSLPHSFPNGSPGINRLNYPAYNEVLGLFALLETPKVEVKTTSGHSYELSAFDQYSMFHYIKLWTIQEKKTYEIRLSEYLKYRFNHAVRDFDFDKTKLYYSFRIKFKKKQITAAMNANGETDQPSIMNEGDFSSEKYSLNNNDYTIITTPFIEVNKILNEPFSIQFGFTRTRSEFSYGDIQYSGEKVEYLYQVNDIESIELKLMADMYFTSQGSKGQDLNTLQIFTYQVYQNSGNDNQMPMEESNTIGNVTFLNPNQKILKHQSGTVVFDNVHFSPSTIAQFPFSTISGNEIHIWVENAELRNNITVDPGFTAFIHFLSALKMNPEGEISPEIILDNIASEKLYNYPLVYEATDDELKSFCEEKNKKYKANTALTKKEHVSQSNLEDSNQSLQMVIYPNPANTLIQVSLRETNSGVIELYDLLGKLVMKKPLTNQNTLSIDASMLQNGIYIINVNTDKGSKSQKIIIEH